MGFERVAGTTRSSLSFCNLIGDRSGSAVLNRWYGPKRTLDSMAHKTFFASGSGCRFGEAVVVRLCPDATMTRCGVRQ